MSELRFAARRLRRAPGFSAAVVLVLALGIGGATAVFSFVNGILLEPLPYPESGRLVRLSHSSLEAGGSTVELSDALVLLYQAQTLAFAGVAAWRPDDGNLRAVDEGQAPVRVRGARVTANFFDVLGVPPVLGRGFESGEDRPGRNGVVVLSHRVWRERLQADPEAIGREILVNDVPRTIVGIMPQEFAYPTSQVELWLPLAIDPAQPRPATFNLMGVGRLKPGVTIEAGRADLARVLRTATPGELGLAPRAQSLRDAIVGPPARLLWVLLGSVLLVLLVACSNVAGLFLVRAQGAQVELAVRGALGSGLIGLLALTVSESVILSALGGAMGVGVAQLGLRGALSAGAALSLPRLENVEVDRTVLLFAVVMTVLCAVCVSLLPLWRLRRVSVASVLRGASNRAGGRSHQRTRDVLVVAQIAVALVLVASSGLMIRSLRRLTEVEPGWNGDRVVTARVLLPFARYGGADARLSFFEAAARATEALPGVSEVALTDWVPLSGDHRDLAIEVEDAPELASGGGANHAVASVDRRYFQTLRIPMLRGRVFEPPSATRPSDEVIVSRAFAQRYWPGGNPIGKRVRPVGGPWHTIVGEVGDVHYDALDQPANAIVYFSLVANMGGAAEAAVPAALSLVVRTGLGEGEVFAAVREIVRSLDDTLPTYHEFSLGALVDNASARMRALVVLLTVASGLTSLLGAIGLYGSMAYGVSLRRRELGVRLALGARTGDLSRMVSFAGLRLAAVGIAIGTACTLATSWLLRGLLYDVSPTDPVTLCATASVLLGIAFVASWIPARRAAGTEIAEALRLD